jgi:hypothetical protein
MWSKAALIKLFVEHEQKLLQLLLDHEPKASAPEPYEPEPKKRKAGPKAGTQEWFKALPPPDRSGLDMVHMLRAAERERPRLPRGPGQQQLRHNGRWAWWS